jgi:hypothetical protein
MKEPRNDVTVGAMDEGRDDEAGDRAMSPEIRRLILSYTTTDSERTWNADSFTGRRANAA